MSVSAEGSPFVAVTEPRAEVPCDELLPEVNAKYAVGSHDDAVVSSVAGDVSRVFARMRAEAAIKTAVRPRSRIGRGERAQQRFRGRPTTTENGRRRGCSDSFASIRRGVILVEAMQKCGQEDRSITVLHRWRRLAVRGSCNSGTRPGGRWRRDRHSVTEPRHRRCVRHDNPNPRVLVRMNRAHEDLHRFRGRSPFLGTQQRTAAAPGQTTAYTVEERRHGRGQ